MSVPITVKVKRLPHGQGIPLPMRMTEHAAGFDLHAAVTEPLVLQPGDIRLIPSGFAVASPGSGRRMPYEARAISLTPRLSGRRQGSSRVCPSARRGSKSAQLNLFRELRAQPRAQHRCRPQKAYPAIRGTQPHCVGAGEKVKLGLTRSRRRIILRV